MAKPFNMNATIRGAIRRTFARAPVKQELLKENRKEFPKYNKDGSRSKKDAVCYLCNVCKEYKGSTKVTVDHITPVISIEEGFVDWNVFVERLYCGKENLQVICDDCHQVKTNQERFDRTYYRENKIVTMLMTAISGTSTAGVVDMALEIDGGMRLLAFRPEQIKFLKKFTFKKLKNYPPEFVEKVLYLKTRLK